MNAYAIAQALYAAGFGPSPEGAAFAQVGVQFVGRINFPKEGKFPLSDPIFTILGDAPSPIGWAGVDGTMEDQLALASQRLISGLRSRNFTCAGNAGMQLPQIGIQEGELRSFGGIWVRRLTSYRIAQDCLITQIEVLACYG